MNEEEAVQFCQDMLDGIPPRDCDEVRCFFDGVVDSRNHRNKPIKSCEPYEDGFAVGQELSESAQTTHEQSLTERMYDTLRRLKNAIRS